MTSSRPSARFGAFTLVELMVSMAVLALLLVMLLAIVNQTSATWRFTTARASQFRQAREAFDVISRRLSQATLNTYWDYDDPASPTRYVRQSELRYISGPVSTVAGSAPSGRQWVSHAMFFQAPLGGAQPGQTSLAGLNTLLNTFGYFVEFGSDASLAPPILAGTSVRPRYRYRLCELIQPTDGLSIYTYTSGSDSSGKPKNRTYVGREWFANSLAQADADRPVHVLSENVIALVILPKLSTQEDSGGTDLAPAYTFDSTATLADPRLNPKNQLPPVVQLTMVALDEGSIRKIENGSTMPDFGLSGLFTDATKFTSDLQTLEKTLSDRHLTYRVFTTSVQLREARWSTDQAN
ncbi:MAG: Verru_Chthon cassette protein C [Candidatus Methylacidiphilales bacterium]